MKRSINIAKQEGFSTLIIVLAIFSVAVVGVVCFRVYQQNISDTNDKRFVNNGDGCGSGTNKASVNSYETENKYINKTGVDEQYGFSISLPKDWGMNEFYTQQVDGREYTASNVGSISYTNPNLPCSGGKSREEVDFRYNIVTSTQDVSNDIVATKISPDSKPEITNRAVTINGLDAIQRIYKWEYTGFGNKSYKGEIKMYIIQTNNRYYYFVLQSKPNEDTADSQFDQIAQSFKISR